MILARGGMQLKETNLRAGHCTQMPLGCRLVYALYSADVSMVWLMRIGIVKAVEGVIIAEFIASSEGLGFLIMQASSFMDMTLMFSSLVAAALMALVFNGALSLGEAILMPWAWRPA